MTVILSSRSPCPADTGWAVPPSSLALWYEFPHMPTSSILLCAQKSRCLPTGWGSRWGARGFLLPLESFQMLGKSLVPRFSCFLLSSSHQLTAWPCAFTNFHQVIPRMSDGASGGCRGSQRGSRCSEGKHPLLSCSCSQQGAVWLLDTPQCL